MGHKGHPFFFLSFTILANLRSCVCCLSCFCFFLFFFATTLTLPPSTFQRNRATRANRMETKEEETNNSSETYHFIFPHSDVFAGEEEAIVLFQRLASGPYSISLASDCFHEVWLYPSPSAKKSTTQRARCIGVGGNRCGHGETYAHNWTCEEGHRLVVRLHWLSPWTGRKLFDQSANVLYRSVFDQSFLAVPSCSSGEWRCAVDRGFACGIKMSTQLARQNILSASRKDPLAVHRFDELEGSWKIAPSPVAPLTLRSVPLKLLEVRLLRGSVSSQNHSTKRCAAKQPSQRSPVTPSRSPERTS